MPVDTRADRSYIDHIETAMTPFEIVPLNAAPNQGMNDMTRTITNPADRRALTAEADALLKGTKAAPTRKEGKAAVTLAQPKVAAVAAPAKPARVKKEVTKATVTTTAAPADTFTTVSLCAEYGVAPKTLRAKVRRHIDALKPLMTSQHVYPNANKAAVVAALKLA